VDVEVWMIFFDVTGTQDDSDVGVDGVHWLSMIAGVSVE